MATAQLKLYSGLNVTPRGTRERRCRGPRDDPPRTRNVEPLNWTKYGEACPSTSAIDLNKTNAGLVVNALEQYDMIRKPITSR